jgi:hypothetical protein
MSYLDNDSGDGGQGDASPAKVIGVAISVLLGIGGIVAGGSGGGSTSAVVTTADATERARTELEQNSPFSKFFTRIRDEHPAEYRKIVDQFAQQARLKGRGTSIIDIDPFIDRFIYAKREAVMRAPAASLRGMVQARLAQLEVLKAEPARCAGDGPDVPLVPLASDPATSAQLAIDLALLDAIRAGEQPGSVEHRPPSDAQLDALGAAVAKQPARAAALLTMEPAERAAATPAERCAANIAYQQVLLSLPDRALAAFVADRYRNLEEPADTAGRANPAAEGGKAAAPGTSANSAAPAKR